MRNEITREREVLTELEEKKLQWLGHVREMCTIRLLRRAAELNFNRNILPGI
jgi:hypothetical protein